MKNIIEIRDYLLKNRVDESGNLDLDGLDFSDFDGNVHICYMKVKKILYQNHQEVKSSLLQDNQSVGLDLFQGHQKVGGNLCQQKQFVKKYLFQHGQYVKSCLFQQNQTVEGFFITQTLKEDEEYKINKYGKNEITKKTKQLTREEIEELLGFKVEIIE